MKGKAFKEDLFPVDLSGLLPVYTLELQDKKTDVIDGFDLWLYLDIKEEDLLYVDWIKQRLTEIVAMRNTDFSKRLVERQKEELVMWYLTFRGAKKIMTKLIAANKSSETGNEKLISVRDFLKGYKKFVNPPKSSIPAVTENIPCC